MNKTEAAFSAYLDVRKAAGELVWTAFEMVTLKIADDTRYTPDFVALTSGNELQFFEVKGYFQEDSRVKIKVAARQFPARFFLVFAKLKRDGGGWDINEVAA